MKNLFKQDEIKSQEKINQFEEQSKKMVDDFLKKNSDKKMLDKEKIFVEEESKNLKKS